MVTIIMPVLNGEKMIEKSIQSVIKQQYVDFELLIVDNGSSDNTVAICKNYVKQDARIRLLYCQETGVVAARNMGIKNAKGMYIAFIDADDEYKPNTLQELVLAMKRYQADIVSCGYENVFATGNIEKCIPDVEGEIDSNLFFEYIFQRGTMGFLWNKLYRASIWKETSIPVGMDVCEDTFINCSLLTKARTVVVIPKSLYRYYENADSVTRSINKKIDQEDNWKYLISYKKIAELVEEDAEKKACVKKATWWIIKLGVEELVEAGQVGVKAKKKLLVEMKDTLIQVLKSKESVRFKVGYLKTFLMNRCKLFIEEYK